MRGPSQINLTAAPDGTFTATAVETADWAPGTYWWTIRARSGDDVHKVDGGQLIVQPDMVGDAGPFDGRSENEKALDAINAVLAKRASYDQERYRINNRELWRTPIPALIQLQAFYANKVKRERAKASGKSAWGRPVHVRFS